MKSDFQLFSDFELDSHIVLKDGNTIYNVTDTEIEYHLEKDNIKLQYFSIFGRYSNEADENGRESIIDVYDATQAMELIDLMEKIKETNATVLEDFKNQPGS